jgi:hypothetical protein
VSRPCQCDRAAGGAYTPDQCWDCWRWRNSDYWRAKWGGEKTVAGLGDEVEALAASVGLDRLATLYEQVTGRPCGCDKRKAILNRLPAVLPAIKRLLGGAG